MKMKKTILFFITACFFINTYGQITKKNWLLGGTGSYSSDKQVLQGSTTELKSAYATLTPNIGYFIADKFAIGINLGFGLNKITATNIPSSSITNYFAGPFAKYYFLPKDKLLNLFLYGNYNYGISRGKNSGVVDKSSGYKYSIAGGPVIFFNNSVGLELSMGWYHSKSIDDKSYTNSIKFGLGFQIHLEK